MPVEYNENTGGALPSKVQTWPELPATIPKQEQEYLTFEGPFEAQLKLSDALASARLEFGPVERSRVGQYGNQRFQYAPLGNLTEATAKPLARHGVTVMFFFTSSPADPAKDRQTTVISGHGARIVACRDFLRHQPKGDSDYKGEPIKELGKLETYFTRYAYRAALALDSEPDADDADVGPQRPPEPRREAPRPEPRNEPQRAMPNNQPATTPRAEPQQPKPVQPAAKLAPAPAADPGAPDPDTLHALNNLATELGLTKISFNQLCIDLVDMSYAEIRSHRDNAQTVLENLQTKVLNKKAQQQARPS